MHRTLSRVREACPPPATGCNQWLGSSGRHMPRDPDVAPTFCASCQRMHTGDISKCMFGILLVCGGRHYSDWNRVVNVLDQMAARMNITMVRHGAAPGADGLADRWARLRAIPVDPMPADWGRLKKAGGPIRNTEMAKKLPVPSACVAFPGNDGTADMVRKCRAAGIPVWEVTP